MDRKYMAGKLAVPPQQTGQTLTKFPRFYCGFKLIGGIGIGFRHCYRRSELARRVGVERSFVSGCRDDGLLNHHQAIPPSAMRTIRAMITNRMIQRNANLTTRKNKTKARPAIIAYARAWSMI